jgi:hypothetical protein
MPFVGDGNAVSDVIWIAFGNGAVVMSLNGTTAYIADASDRDAVNRKVMRAHTLNLAAMRLGVTETNHISHWSPFFCGDVSSFWLPAAVLPAASFAAISPENACAIVGVCAAALVRVGTSS